MLFSPFLKSHFNFDKFELGKFEKKTASLKRYCSLTRLGKAADGFAG
jgi:hypothetical protein